MRAVFRLSDELIGCYVQCPSNSVGDYTGDRFAAQNFVSSRDRDICAGGEVFRTKSSFVKQGLNVCDDNFHERSYNTFVKLNNTKVLLFLMSSYWDSLKAVISDEMETRGVSKTALAERLGWQQPVVSRYLGEKAEMEPSLEKIQAILSALNLTLSEAAKRAEQKSQNLKVVATSHGRDELLAQLMDMAVQMSPEELQTIVNVVQKTMAKRAAKKDPKNKTQAG